jgi:hypothetical protein
MQWKRPVLMVNPLLGEITSDEFKNFKTPLPFKHNILVVLVGWLCIEVEAPGFMKR